jgi:chorismate synthase
MPLELLTAGESHGPALTVILAGMPAGLPLDEGLVAVDLARRQTGAGAGGRMAIEKDRARILAGVMAGVTTGAPIAMEIANSDFEHWQGREVPAYTTPRPGHADLAAVAKYGFDDIRPALERASARETAARVAAGAVCRAFLKAFGIEIGGYVAVIGGVRAELSGMSWGERAARARNGAAQCPDSEADAAMVDAIAAARKDGETVGGLIEVAVTGLPAGLGSYVTPERRLDARLAAAVMSVPAIKGFEIGEGFASAALRGTEVHDPITLEGGRLMRPTDNCGGLEGGMTNGCVLWFRAAMKPIPTVLKGIGTVDLATGKQGKTKYERSDICPVPRAVVVLEAVAAKVLAEALMEKLGGDSLAEMLPRFKALKKTEWPDCKLGGKPQVFWQ